MAPNIVFILTDNQSPWTLGCYGNTDIHTPHIDRLAAEGIRFENARCVNPVCSPNRATCLTGLLPSQHGVHNFLGGENPDSQMGPEAYCTISEFANWPAILSKEGYDCGLSGKWHLGDSLHPQLGFRYWFTKPRGHTRHFYGEEAIWQGQVYKEKRYATEVIAEHAEAFLDQDREQPFFLYVGFNGPYGLDQDALQGHRNRHSAYYADKTLSCFPDEPAHPWLVQMREHLNNPVAQRSYAAAVSGVDDAVGRILSKLAERDQARETLVVFTADHGLCGGHNGMWGMGDHARPTHLFETNLKIPLIMRHPGSIPSAATCPTMVANYDLFPSLLAYLGLSKHLPQDRELPGRSFSNALRGRPLEDWGEEITYHEYEGTRALCTREWKLILRHVDGPQELYHLKRDPEERHNLFNEPDRSEIQNGLCQKLKDFFAIFADPNYDLWKEGRSKAGRVLSLQAR